MQRRLLWPEVDTLRHGNGVSDRAVCWHGRPMSGAFASLPTMATRLIEDFKQCCVYSALHDSHQWQDSCDTIWLAKLMYYLQRRLWSVKTPQWQRSYEVVIYLIFVVFSISDYQGSGVVVNFYFPERSSCPSISHPLHFPVFSPLFPYPLSPFPLSARGNPLEFRDKTYPALQPFLTDPPVWQTDRRTGDSI